MSKESKQSNPLLVIVGMAGSGKSSMAHYLERKGWRVIRFGALTMRELELRHLPINEANEKTVREELRAKNGMAAYAKLLLPTIVKSLSAGPTVIDGLYSWSEYKYLKSNVDNHLKLVAIYTTRSVRYGRLSKRPERPLSFKEAEQRDFAEIENAEKGGPIAIADYVIINDGPEDDLYKAVDDLLSTIYPSS